MSETKCKCGYSTWTRRLPDRGTIEFGVRGWYWGDRLEDSISDIDLADGADRYCYSCGCQLLPGGAVRDWREEADKLQEIINGGTGIDVWKIIEERDEWARACGAKTMDAWMLGRTLDVACARLCDDSGTCALGLCDDEHENVECEDCPHALLDSAAWRAHFEKQAQQAADAAKEDVDG